MPRQKTPLEEMQETIRDAVSDTPRSISERAALEAALEVAEEWKMRLDELGDDTDSDDSEDEG
jgi:hypothetical protein